MESFDAFFLELQCQQDSLEFQDFPDDSCTIKENGGLHLRDVNCQIQFIEMFL